MINIYFDGGTALNSVCFYDENRDFYDIQKHNLPMTNNELEYIALMYAIKYYKQTYTNKKVTFYGDSELIIKHMNGEYKVSANNLKPYYNAIQSLITDNVIVRWIPRYKNLAGIKLEQLLKDKRS